MVVCRGGGHDADHNGRQRVQQRRTQVHWPTIHATAPEATWNCSGRASAEASRAGRLPLLAYSQRRGTGVSVDGRPHNIRRKGIYLLPNLVSYDDLRGCFHCHTSYSDGKATVAEMAEAAFQREIGRAHV